MGEFDSRLWSGMLAQLLLLFLLLGFPFVIFALKNIWFVIFFSNLSFIGPFLGNCHCRKLGPSIEKFLASLVSPSGRLPSSVKDQLAYWLSKNFTFLRFSFLLLSIACWPWCCKNSFFVILFLPVISNESSSSDKSFCDFYVNHPESIFDQNKQPKMKWFCLFFIILTLNWIFL